MASGVNVDSLNFNYRVRGTAYVVDRLFEAAELRLGTPKAQGVSIIRIADAPKRRAGARP